MSKPPPFEPSGTASSSMAKSEDASHQSQFQRDFEKSFNVEMANPGVDIEAAPGPPPDPQSAPYFTATRTGSMLGAWFPRSITLSTPLVIFFVLLFLLEGGVLVFYTTIALYGALIRTPTPILSSNTGPTSVLSELEAKRAGQPPVIVVVDIPRVPAPPALSDTATTYLTTTVTASQPSVTVVSQLATTTQVSENTLPEVVTVTAPVPTRVHFVTLDADVGTDDRETSTGTTAVMLVAPSTGTPRVVTPTVTSVLIVTPSAS